MKSIIEKHLKDNLDEVCNASTLTEEEYALIRKGSFGASDSSILCNVNLYKTKEQLLTEKNSKFLTDEEKEVGKKPAVRKGRDLEPLVLNKFTESTKLKTIKPEVMYRHKDFEYLTTNFDGVTIESTFIIPVEAKVVTKFGEKYYKKYMPLNKIASVTRKPGTIEEHIKAWAAICGIPAYYYTQVQQQILFLDSAEYKCPYGYLAALFDDSWDFCYFYVPRDEFVISHIIAEGSKLYEKINKA